MTGREAIEWYLEGYGSFTEQRSDKARDRHLV